MSEERKKLCVFRSSLMVPSYIFTDPTVKKGFYQYKRLLYQLLLSFMVWFYNPIIRRRILFIWSYRNDPLRRQISLNIKLIYWWVHLISYGFFNKYPVDILLCPGMKLNVNLIHVHLCLLCKVLSLIYQYHGKIRKRDDKMLRKVCLHRAKTGIEVICTVKR